MADLSNPIASDLPLDLQEEMLSLARRRQIANALRARNIQDPEQQAVNGMVLPSGFSTLGRNLDAISGQIDLDNIDQRSKGAVSKYQEGLKGATSKLLGMMDPFAQVSPQEMGDNASQAMLAGVPKELINSALQQRLMVANTNAIGGADSPFAPPSAMGFVPPGGAQGAPGAAAVGPAGAPVGGSTGGGSMGFMPGGPGDVPGNGPGRPATPYSNWSTKRLFLAGTLPGPMQEIAKQELAARKVTINREGIATDGQGNVLYQMNSKGQVIDYTRMDGGKPSVSDPLVTADAARSGLVAGAESKAKLPNETVEVTNSDGSKQIVSKEEALAMSAAKRGGARAPGGSMGFVPGDQVNVVSPATSDPSQLAALAASGAAPKAKAPLSVAEEAAQAAQAAPKAPVNQGVSPSMTASAFAGANAEAQKVRVEAINKEGAASAENNAQLADISHHLHNADTSYMTPARLEAARMLHGMGFDESSPVTQFVAGGNIGALQAIVKDSTGLAATATAALGSREAAQVFMQLLQANPNIATSPDGMAKVIDFLHGVNQYKVERASAMPAWIQNSPTGDIQGFESWMVGAHPPQSYIGHLRPGAAASKADQGKGYDVSNGVATPASSSGGWSVKRVN